MIQKNEKEDEKRIKIEQNNLESIRYSWNAMENRWYWKKIFISFCRKELWGYWKQKK